MFMLRVSMKEMMERVIAVNKANEKSDEGRNGKKNEVKENQGCLLIMFTRLCDSVWHSIFQDRNEGIPRYGMPQREK